MYLPRLVVFALFLVAGSSLHGQAMPAEYATFMSHGKAVSCAVYETRDITATMIFLRGSSPADLAIARLQARFFAEHGFRVLLPDYLSATTSARNNRCQLSPLGPGSGGHRRRVARASLTAKQENRPCGTGPGSLCRPGGCLAQNWTSMLSPNGLACSPINFFPGAEPSPAAHPAWRAG